MIQIQLQGVRKVRRFIEGLPKNMEKEIDKENGKFIKDVQKSAKLRAPRMTGELANSIVVTKNGKSWILEVKSPYGKYQEEGFRPHWVHALLPTRNKLGTIGEAFNIAGFAKVSKHTPFIKPALEHNLSKLAQRMGRATRKAIGGSK
ncbi:hypothetical protein DRN69_05130 [Candidatus Pacearchaeota archaeon]|nr:MAG: hypothetical protein DRN69_05130 [Candidatus Pacearchaeota archaeon]